MRTGWHIQETYQCDACGAVVVTAGGIPGGWGEYNALVSSRGAGTPVYSEHVPDVHVCPPCLGEGPGILGRRVHDLLAMVGEEATNRGA